MEFPAEASMALNKNGNGYKLDEESVKVNVNTDKYYE